MSEQIIAQQWMNRHNVPTNLVKLHQYISREGLKRTLSVINSEPSAKLRNFLTKSIIFKLINITWSPNKFWIVTLKFSDWTIILWLNTYFEDSFNWRNLWSSSFQVQYHYFSQNKASIKIEPWDSQVEKFFKYTRDCSFFSFINSLPEVYRTRFEFNWCLILRKKWHWTWELELHKLLNQSVHY